VTPLSPPLGSGDFSFWRIDADKYAPTWHNGEGPATAILEVAVHKGFKVLDTQAHTLTTGRIRNPDTITVIEPKDVPNPNWLTPCTPNSNQQEFGDRLLANNLFVLIPSAVSKHSWNLIFDATKAGGEYSDVRQDRFSLDPRLQS